MSAHILQIGDGIDPAHIGARLNQWQTPVTVFEGCDAIWLNTIKKSEYVGKIAMQLDYVIVVILFFFRGPLYVPLMYCSFNCFQVKIY